MKLKNLFLSLKNKISFLYGKNKKLFVWGIVLLVLVFVFLFAFPKENYEDKNLAKDSESVKNISLGYEEELEFKIQKMLVSISEVSVANVMVFCDSSERYEYLKNVSETSSGSGDSASKTITEEVVYEKNGSNSSPIVISKTMPKVLGVWIVINQVSPSTKLVITNSICSVLNIDASCISILQE